MVFDVDMLRPGCLEVLGHKDSPHAITVNHDGEVNWLQREFSHHFHIHDLFRDDCKRNILHGGRAQGDVSLLARSPVNQVPVQEDGPSGHASTVCFPPFLVGVHVRNYVVFIFHLKFFQSSNHSFPFALSTQLLISTPSCLHPLPASYIWIGLDLYSINRAGIFASGRGLSPYLTGRGPDMLH